MKQKGKRRKMAAAVMSIFVIMLASLTVYAEDAKILETNVYGGEIYIYIKGVTELPSDTSVQIGNTVCPAEQIAASAFEQLNPFMRTLILVDNSKSIPEKKHADIQAIIKGIIAGAKENEQIKIATFSKEAMFLCDYTNDHSILENIVDNISYNDQDTYLSDVLYNAILGLKSEDTYAYRRIIVLSDGADDNFIGYTNDEVRRYIESSQCPVYTIGIPQKNNSTQLETMFSFSRAAKADYFLLDENTANEDIVNAIMTDQTGICLKLNPDESLKDGSVKSILLKLGTSEGAVELKTSVEMPFGNASLVQAEPETVAEPESEIQTEPESSLPSLSPTALDEETDNDDENEQKSETPQTYIVVLIVILAVIAVLAIVAVVLIVLKQKKGRKAPAAAPAPEKPPEEPPADTVMTRLPDTGQNGTPEKELWGKKQLILRNLDNPGIFFKVPINDAVSIGRSSTQNIVISDDEELSREHCKIFLRGELMYLKRCESSNGTYYENVALPIDGEVPIISGGKIRIGKHRYCVELVDEI